MLDLESYPGADIWIIRLVCTKRMVTMLQMAYVDEHHQKVQHVE